MPTEFGDKLLFHVAQLTKRLEEWELRERKIQDFQINGIAFLRPFSLHYAYDKLLFFRLF
jgi:hypothetical protein